MSEHGSTLTVIGSPPATVVEWLESFAETNEQEEHLTPWPWAKAKYRGQAWAFHTAADLVRRATV